jgi:hypothetical protein
MTQPDIYNGPAPGYQVAADDDGLGAQLQLVKLVASTDGQRVAIPADSGGLTVKFGDSPSVDAFSRLRVSTPDALFEQSFEYEVSSFFWESVTATDGTVAHSSSLRSAVLTATATSGSLAAIQSRQYLPYLKGRSQLCKFTFVMGAAAANVTRRVGLFDADDGIMLEQTGDGLALRIRSSIGDDELVAQAAWNIDPMDGTGPSGLTLDMTKAQILAFDFQWLGVGRVRCGFSIDGTIYPVHAFNHANRTDVAPYMRTALLPVRYEVTSTAASAGATLQVVCAEVESEGAAQTPNGQVFAARNATAVTVGTTTTHMLSIRPATTLNSITNRLVIIPLDVSILAGAQALTVDVLYDATLSGGSWATPQTGSGVEIGTGQTHTGGTLIDSFFVGASGPQVRQSAVQSLSFNYPLTLDAAGANPKALSIVATAVTSTSDSRAAVQWREVR